MPKYLKIICGCYIVSALAGFAMYFFVEPNMSTSMLFVGVVSLTIVMLIFSKKNFARYLVISASILCLLIMLVLCIHLGQFKFYTQMSFHIFALYTLFREDTIDYFE